MATKPRAGKRGRPKRPPKQDDIAADELALAEELLRKGKEEHAEFVAGFRKFMKQMGIKGKPISPKKLRERMIREGLDPNGNEFSQGIIAMREE